MNVSTVGGGPPGGVNGGLVSKLENIATSRFVRPNQAQLLEILTAYRDAMKKTGTERKAARRRAYAEGPQHQHDLRHAHGPRPR